MYGFFMFLFVFDEYFEFFVVVGYCVILFDIYGRGLFDCLDMDYDIDLFLR